MTTIPLNRARLEKLAKEVTTDPRWFARDGMTFCNYALAVALKAFRVPKEIWADDKGSPKQANAMIEAFKAHTDFHQLSEYADAQQLANAGLLVIAGVKGSQHGHVCFLAPSDKLFYSGKHRAHVPFVANVGKTNKIVPLSYAYSPTNKPTLWYYEPSKGTLLT